MQSAQERHEIFCGGIGKHNSEGHTLVLYLQSYLRSTCSAIIASDAGGFIIEGLDAIEASTDGFFIDISGSCRCIGNNDCRQWIIGGWRRG